jgi:hypothetical protein
VYDASTKKQIETPVIDARTGNNVNAAFSSGVAAMAFDKKNNRLYFTPMLFDQLRYLDLKSMKVYYLADQILTGQAKNLPDQSKIITRMVIAADGNGYALMNDGTQLIRFSTGKKVSVADLGTLVDDPSNQTVSIHNSCSSYGGDMIADDKGNLFVFTAYKNVFKVNIDSKIATHLGTVSGLPAGFSINGAVVTDDNKILVSSAMPSTSCFIVDLKNLSAIPYTINGTVWQSSDLANSNILVTSLKSSNTAVEMPTRKTPANTGDGKISIYPNPVVNNEFVIQFNSLETGSYTLNVTDVMGRQVIQQVVAIGSDNQAQTIKVDPAVARGVYLVNVFDLNSKSVYSTKIVLQ